MRKALKIRNAAIFFIALAVSWKTFAQVDVGTFPQQYKNAAMAAWPIVEPFARSLFWILAGIQLAWAAIMLALEKSDLQGWTAGLIRQLFFIGLGAAIILNAKDWMWAIFNSFAKLGTTVSHEALEPGDIFGIGVQMAWEISNKHVGFNIPLGLAYLLCAGAIMVAFTFIAISLLLALVEGAIAVVLGQVLLGFAGSKWTIGYTEKYFGMIINVGLKVFVTYFMAGIAITISKNWIAIANATSEISKVYELVGGAIILCAVVWAVPRFVSMVIGGAPSLGFTDAAGVVAGMATAVGTAAGGALTGAAKAGDAIRGIGKGNSIGSGTTSNAPSFSGNAVSPPIPTSGSTGGAGTRPTSFPAPLVKAPGSSMTSDPGTAGGNGIGAAARAESGEGGGESASPGSSPSSTGSAGRSGGPDVIASTARAVASAGGMSQFLPSSIGAAGAGSSSASGAAASMPGSSAAVPPPARSAELGARGGTGISGNPPTGITAASMGAMPPSAPGHAGNGAVSSSAGFSTGSSAAAAGSAPPETSSGFSGVAGIAQAGFDAIGASGSSGSGYAPPPPTASAPAPAPAPLPGVSDDYERMDAANRKNKLLFDQRIPAGRPVPPVQNRPKP